MGVWRNSNEYFLTSSDLESPISAYEKNIIEKRCREVLNNNYVKKAINEACKNIMHEYFKRLKITDYIYEGKFKYPTLEKVRYDMQESIQEVAVHIVHKRGLDLNNASIEKMISLHFVLNAIDSFEKAVIARLRKDRNEQIYFSLRDVVRISG